MLSIAVVLSLLDWMKRSPASEGSVPMHIHTQTHTDTHTHTHPLDTGLSPSSHGQALDFCMLILYYPVYASQMVIMGLPLENMIADENPRSLP